MSNKPKKAVKEKSMTVKKMIIVFSVLIGIMAVVFRNAYVNNAEIEKQVKHNLEDVARQNAGILDAKIQAQYRLLIALSEEMDGVTKATIENRLEHFRLFVKEFHLKRFGYCFPDGMTYSTDNEPADLSYREFYQEGMKGNCYITGILTDALGKEHCPVNVMTIPVRDDAGEVCGVFGLTYDTEIFNESLQIDSFDGDGYSCIINEEGEIMSVNGGNGLKLSRSIIEEMRNADERNEQSIGELQELIAQKKEGSGTFYLQELQYYYMIPLDLMDGSVTWYIMTIIPSEVLSRRVAPIQENQYLTVFLVVLLVLIGALMMFVYMKEQHGQMIRFAYEDPVTKGANYTKFQMEMERKSDHSGYLIGMDIANFDNISVVAGKAGNEAMIRATWQIISEVLEKEELAAHIREDQFLLFLKGEEEEKVLGRMGQISARIYGKAKEFDVYGVQARYGIYRMSEKETVESAYSKVRLAREYAVIRLGVNYAFYDEVGRVRMQYEKQLEDSFQTAVDEEEFEVWYQPKYSAADCRIVASEALVRWRKPDGGMISPGEFIPLFERNGMIVRLDEYMFRSVCRQQKQRLEEGRVVYPVSINISRATLYCMDIHKRYQGILQEYGLEPQYIQLEVTETVLEGKADIYELLNKFRQMGIKILMDDFGTGYSSLATLSLQCFDTLKLDKSLIDHIGSKEGDIMLYHIIRMGQQMGLRITAEGVEDKTQLRFLQDMKCDDIQGFYFSKPVPRETYEEMTANVRKQTEAD